MKILCSSSQIKLIFGKDSEFAGRSLRMKGEALNNGFDADADSMTWLSPIGSEAVDDKTKAKISELIAAWNSGRDFQIMFMGRQNRRSGNIKKYKEITK
jgi:hypothetical protein